MPGKILNIPYLSQIEDIDKYLQEYKNQKIIPQNSMDYQHGNKVNSNNNNTNAYYNYNNGHRSKGHQGYYKKSVYSGNRGYVKNNNSNNYDNYMNNYDYLNYNRKKLNENSSYGYNSTATNLQQFNNGNDVIYSKQSTDYVISQSNNGDMSMNPSITEYLKQTYPQIYENSQSKTQMSYSHNVNDAFSVNDVTNGLNNLQFGAQTERNNEQYLHNSGTSPFNYQNNNDDINFGVTSSQHNVNLNNAPSNMVPFKPYMAPQLVNPKELSPNNGQIPSNFMNQVSNTSSSLINQTQPPSIQHSVGFGNANPLQNTSASSSTSSLKFSPSHRTMNLRTATSTMTSESLLYGNVNSNINMAPSTNSNTSNQNNLSSIGWGSNQMDIQGSIPGRSSTNATTGSSNNMFGIWNNDMSVWS